MKKRLRILLPLLLLLAVIIAFFLAIRARQKPALPGEIHANGTMETTEVDVTARLPGRLRTVLPHEGDAVREQQVVVTLDNADVTAQARQAQEAYQAAEANLAELLAGTRPEDIERARAQYQAALEAKRQAQARLDLVLAGPRQEDIQQLQAVVRQARVTLDDANTELRRAEALEKQSAISGQQVDRARTQRDVAAAQLEAARQRLLEAQHGSRPEEVSAAQAAVAQAAAQVEAARAQLELARAGARLETIDAARARVAQAKAAWEAVQVQAGYARVPSPLTGTVISRNLEPGEYAAPGTPILRVAALDRVWLRVYVSETDLGRVKLGQRASITTDTYPGKGYEGRVTEIAQQAEFTPRNVQTEEEREKLVYGVKITVPNPQHELKPGMPADAVIYTK